MNSLSSSVATKSTFLISFLVSEGFTSCFFVSTMSSFTPILNNCKVGSILTFLIPSNFENLSNSDFKSEPGGTANVNHKLN